MTQASTETKTAEPVKPTAHFAALHAELTEALNLAEFGAPDLPNPPAQCGVLLQAGRDRLTVETFDFWTAVSVTIPAATPVAKGWSLLDFDELKKALAALAAGETKAVANRIPVALAGDLLSTPDMAVPVMVRDLHEFTHPPESVPAMATVDAKAFLSQLERVLPCAGRDDTLPALTGVQMTLEGETLTMAATDRYRFGVATVPADATVEPSEKPLTTLIPADLLRRLAKRLKCHEGPVGIGIIEADVDGVARTTLTVGNTRITMRPLEGGLPKYTSLFPTKRETSIRVERSTLVRAVKKAAALIKAKGENGAAVTLAWSEDKVLTLFPRIGEDDRARVKGMEIPTAFTHGTADNVRGSSLSFNPALLLDALGTFPADTLTLHLRPMEDGQGKKPVLLTDGPDVAGDGYRHLLMPVRLDLIR
ncbi:DNA polymerase III subunit beta [Streptomyces sp. NPDC006733]|uniref:DNA polymerase III subunit beta n=1 Tax=Streptomyces sp. NPDC006733 TaxID=3155460 RepID=UPI003407731E